MDNVKFKESWVVLLTHQSGIKFKESWVVLLTHQSGNIADVAVQSRDW